MSVEFVDTNVFIYAHDSDAGMRHEKSVELLTRLIGQENGAISIQVLSEFYIAATRKLSMDAEEVEAAIEDMSVWTTHRPAQTDILKASRLHRRHQLSWWDAMIVNSAIESGCSVLWSEDLNDGQKYGTVVVRNPFK